MHKVGAIDSMATTSSPLSLDSINVRAAWDNAFLDSTAVVRWSWHGNEPPTSLASPPLLHQPIASRFPRARAARYRLAKSVFSLPLFCSENSTGLSSDNFECPSRCALPTQMRTPNGKFGFPESSLRRVERHIWASESPFSVK